MQMARNYTVRTKILRPVAEVFDAVVSSDKLRGYFTDGASGDLKEGEEIIWHWNDHGDFPVVVEKVVANKLIELTLDSKKWQKTGNEAYDVRVIMEFESLEDGSTMLSISEAGWKTDADGLKGSHDNCGGWTHMAMCLKAWIEHGIDLR
jgi:uncharacterized protein YndB with AHSA1/START domain